MTWTDLTINTTDIYLSSSMAFLNTCDVLIENKQVPSLKLVSLWKCNLNYTTTNNAGN